MQVFLNLVQNSERAMSNQPRRALSVSARVEQERIVVEFRDTGGGVRNPERLFRPFQQGAQATGLGLYLSRAFMRSFRGDLRYEPEPGGSSFIVELSPLLSGVGKESHGSGDQDSIGGRSRLVPGEPQPAAPEPSLISGSPGPARPRTKRWRFSIGNRSTSCCWITTWARSKGLSFLESSKKKGFAGRVLMVTAGMTDAGHIARARKRRRRNFPEAQPARATGGSDPQSDERRDVAGSARGTIAGGRRERKIGRAAHVAAAHRARAGGAERRLRGLHQQRDRGASCGTSEGTIKAAMQQLFDKTGVRTRSQLVRIALERLTGEWRPGEP